MKNKFLLFREVGLLKFTNLSKNKEKGVGYIQLLANELALTLVYIYQMFYTNLAFIWHFVKFNFQIAWAIIWAIVGIISVFIIGILNIIPFTFKFLFFVSKSNKLEKDLDNMYHGVSKRPWDKKLQSDLVKKQNEYDFFIADDKQKEVILETQKQDEIDALTEDERRMRETIMRMYPNLK